LRRSYFCSSAFECRLDRIAKKSAIKIEISGELPQFIEVFHPCVDNSQLHKCLKLLGDDGFLWVGHETGSWEIEHSWIFNFLRWGYDDVTEAYIRLHVNPGELQASDEIDAESFITLVLR
jgi:hypothetical protein